jgi:hypothetical protein
LHSDPQSPANPKFSSSAPSPTAQQVQLRSQAIKRKDSAETLTSGSPLDSPLLSGSRRSSLSSPLPDSMAPHADNDRDEKELPQLPGSLAKVVEDKINNSQGKSSAWSAGKFCWTNTTLNVNEMCMC